MPLGGALDHDLPTLNSKVRGATARAMASATTLLADLLEIEGQDAFRVLAYRRAATRIRETGGSIVDPA